MVNPNKTNNSGDPVPLKDVLKQLVDADLPELSAAEQARKTAANRVDAEHHAQEAREDWRDLQENVSWQDVDPAVLHRVGELVVETQAELKSQDPRP